MKKLITFSLTIFILSCATGPPTQIFDNGFISSRPDFQVQFHKPIVEKSEKSRRVQRGDIKIYTFDVNYREGIVIMISTFIPDRSGFFLYGPEQVLTNWGRIALDPVVFDGRQWIKFVDFSKNKNLVIGYFRIIDKSAISVCRFCIAGAYAEEIESIKSGTPLNDRQRKLLDEEFSKADQLFSIGVVEYATVAPKRVLEPYQVIFTTGLKDQKPINDLTEISINEKQIYIFVSWHNLKQKKYEYESKVYDGAGKLAYRGNHVFTPKKRIHNTWTYRTIQKHVDKPGKWRFEIYLDGEKLVDQSVTVLPES